MTVFHQQFGETYRTHLIGGATEPLYRPATTKDGYAEIRFTRDYESSALHEVAHWCVAGAHRREQVDYGYWYTPDGRSPQQQRVFEQVEVKPQAIERIFSYACGIGFRVSADNLDGELGAGQAFCAAIHNQTLSYCEQGLSHRAEAFAKALALEFARDCPLAKRNYHLGELL